MKRVSIVGHFSFTHNSHDGQTIKTRVFGDEVKRRCGESNVSFHDTESGWRFLLRLPLVALKLVAEAKHIVMMPGVNGLRFIPFWLSLWNVLFGRSLHYVVIGGWLAEYTQKHTIIRRILRRFSTIAVETERLKCLLEEQGFANVVIMPNCKPLQIVSDDSMPDFDNSKPFPFCTFSRVIEEKGICDAIAAISAYNARKGYVAAELDIYGQVEDEEWFDTIKKGFPEYVHYRGLINYSDTTSVLIGYYALLFPTFYPGECFAGTLIDAMASGLPVIASDWHDNSQIVVDGQTGLIFPTRNVDSLTDCIERMIGDSEMNKKMRINSLRMAGNYLPQSGFREVIDKFV